ncbi:MAG: cyclic pyranopterin monophosphate synthase MoaC [Gammaproteobacteria bacterium]|nr:cyclic pyranopterin monophosphate synthase MoaC [Gammaproteobacteria bacterium]
MAKLSHINADGEAQMVDISTKSVTQRVATAAAVLKMAPSTLTMILDGEIPKGDVFAVARIAGIQAAKRTSELIPLCHPLSLTNVVIDFESQNDEELHVRASASVNGQTGVEMEALTAVTVAALTVYDMCKAVQKDIAIADIRLLSKSGGKSGSWQAE